MLIANLLSEFKSKQWIVLIQSVKLGQKKAKLKFPIKFLKVLS